MVSAKSKFIIPLLIGLLFSCKDEEVYTVGIDLTNAYNNDEVQVILDGKLLLDEILQSDLSTSLATTLRAKKTSGKHTLKVIINDTYSKTEVVSLKDDLYIFVSYDPSTNEISFNYSDKPVSYD